jgi:hypothetical protein
MTDKDRLNVALQEYLRERKILKGNASATAFHLIAMALIRIVNLLEKRAKETT